MITYSRFKRTIGPGMCRKCINRLFGLNLQPKDCVYLYYPHPCGSCGGVENLVVRIHRISRFKLLFGRKPREGPCLYRQGRLCLRKRKLYIRGRKALHSHRMEGFYRSCRKRFRIYRYRYGRSVYPAAR